MGAKAFKRRLVHEVVLTNTAQNNFYCFKKVLLLIVVL